MDVRPAETQEDLEQVGRLFRGFLAWHRQQHPDELDLIDAYFDEAAYRNEIDALPGTYAPPDGALLVCWDTGLAVGASPSRDSTRAPAR